MTPAQQQALEALFGKPLTTEQLAAIEPLLGVELTDAERARVAELISFDDEMSDAQLAELQALRLKENRDDVQIAALLSDYQPDARRSLRVDEVFDELFRVGDYTPLKQAQMSGNPHAVMAFAALADAKQLGSGSVNLDSTATSTMLADLQGAGLLTQAGMDALQALANIRPPSINFARVSDALNAAEGRATLASLGIKP